MFPCLSFAEKCGRLGLPNAIKTSYHQNELNNTINFSVVTVDDYQHAGPRNLKYMENAQTSLSNSLDTIIQPVKSAIKGGFERVDDAFRDMSLTLDKTGELAMDGFSGFSSVLKDATCNLGIVAIDTFRRTIVVSEDALSKAATSAVYVYGLVKDLLPLEVQHLLTFSEEKTHMFFSPVGMAFHQAYVLLESLETIIGLDPNDPIVPVVLFLGASTTLWGTYLVLKYGGYAGDLSPKSSFQLLVGKENAVLIDVRPERLRKSDGIPDLRRAARFRYASVALPEVDESLKKLLKSWRDLEITLLAAIIRDLKIVQDETMVIVMDDDGARSKGIARSLRKLGLKRPYVMQGGFRSWINEGLRIKELKPETALSIISEEVEAIIEEINPTPLKLLGYGTGFIALVYASLELEKTLQLIGFLGLLLTIYLRLSSYEDSEDIKQDVGLVLGPFRLGGRAISWAIGKFDRRGDGLPTLPPCSSDVHSRVLQAAAKHESQPSEDPSSATMASPNGSVDLPQA